MRKLALIIVLICVTSSILPASARRSPYVAEDAYQVYSALIEAKKIPDLDSQLLLISAETEGGYPDSYGCRGSGEIKAKFNHDDETDAIMHDYQRANRHKRTLQPLFTLDHSYKLIAAAELRKYFPEKKPPRWDDFFRDHAGSRVYITLSAVGFNRNRDVAFVQVRVDCGVLCGNVNLYQLRKVDGKWQQSKPIGCGLVF